MNELDEQKEYEGRADYIADEDLSKWTVDNKHFEDIQKKLIGRIPVLIAGPRGSGKTHQMKVVYNQCLHEAGKPMAIYVTYGKYYHLEPFLFKESNAINIFHTWILGKILLGCHQLLKDKGIDSQEENKTIGEFGPLDDLQKFVSHLERGLKEDWHDSLISKITIQSVVDYLNDMAHKLERRRTILLLDDAALTLTPEYMKEFFDVFRGLRTGKISPKASVYPGTTEYGPGFHLGHDAEKVEIWFNVEDPESNFHEFVDVLLDKRLPALKREIPVEIIELLKYASFGLPRAFINLVKSYREKDEKNLGARFNRVIDDQSNLIEAEYLTLGKKMSQYKSIIKTGHQLFKKVVDVIADENKKMSSDEYKHVIIGINQEKKLNFSRMIKFLNEAGLLYELQPVRHGDDREYDRYVPHLLFLIKNRAFSIGKGFDARKTLDFMKRKSAKHPVRRQFDTLLDKKQIGKIKLDLPPCANCGAERVTEGQRFCHHCGVELVEKSKFESCLEIPIEELPLSQRLKEIISDATDFKTVGDIILSPAPGSDLQEGPYIGPKRSKKILGIVTKTVEEFLA